MPLYIYSVIRSALEIYYDFPETREREKPARLTRRRELPGIIKTKFTRALEKLARAATATSSGERR